MKQTQPLPADLNALIALFNNRSYAEAEDRARLMLEQHPDFSFCWKLLGGVLQMQGKYALPAFQKVVELMPEDAEANYNLGVVLKGMGRLDDAATSYRRALSIRPDYVEAHSNLGNTLKELNRLDDAASSYLRLLELLPENANAHIILGNIQKELGQFDNAVASYRMAVKLKPDSAAARNNLGNILKEVGQLDDAVASYRQALALEPNNAVTHNNLGIALKDLMQIDAAVACYRRAVEIEPNFAEAHSNLAICLLQLYKLDGAEDSSLRVLKINPDYIPALLTLGNIYKETCRIEEAIACCRRALELDATSTAARSNLLYLLSFYPGIDNRKLFDEINKIASSFNLVPKLVGSYTGRDNNPDRRLRIGYVSPDFRHHCQSFFTIPLLSNHDHEQFEIFLYAQLSKTDEISNRLRTYSDGWRTTHQKTDPQVAEMIVNDKIDILIDLTMHMAKARPKLFASKPAPVQVAWLAYPGTTGISAIDYRLTDPWLDPPELGDDCYTEKSIRLPDTFWCYDPLVTGLKPNALPALTNGHITFGCLNNFSKVSDDTLCRWGQVMAKVPSSRLILLAPEGRHRQRIFDLLGRYNVVAGRIELVELQPRLQYLQTYHRIDICLDTLPYNGHTTSLDAYWMGVPVVTQVGNTIAGRAGWSQLNNLGLTELAAFDENSFVDIAVELANDLTRVSKLRQTLRVNMEASPLMDGKRFAKAIENIYRNIWQSACNNLPEN